jgi:8-oxo-dGTP pyrophosphatase MutT (NUDIX family)
MKNSLLRVALESIPSHRERPQSYAALTQRVADRTGLLADPAATALRTALELLRLLDLVQDSDEHIALSNQTQTYFRNSLVWYLENDRQIVSNWDRHGTAQEEISIANLLDQAPFLLKALEERRLTISKEFDIPLSASREQTCSVVLFKTAHVGTTYLLHQWDQRAERYQLIGGKQRANENHETTATREVLEELRNANLVPDKTLFISKCRIAPVEYWEISRTYGALTRYELHVFNAIVTQRELKTSESDLWISLQEALDGRTFSGAPIAPLVERIARRDQGFFNSLPPSLEIQGEWRRSVRITKPAETAAAYPDPEPPEHLSIGWIGRLLLRLSLHDLALIVGAVVSLLGATFAAGRAYQAHTSAGVHSRADADQLKPVSSSPQPLEPKNSTRLDEGLTPASTGRPASPAAR